MPKAKEDRKADTAVHKANILKALAHPLRVRIFEAIADGEKPMLSCVEQAVCNIADEHMKVAACIRK